MNKQSHRIKSSLPPVQVAAAFPILIRVSVYCRSIHGFLSGSRTFSNPLAAAPLAGCALDLVPGHQGRKAPGMEQETPHFHVWLQVWLERMDFPRQADVYPGHYWLTRSAVLCLPLTIHHQHPVLHTVALKAWCLSPWTQSHQPSWNAIATVNRTERATRMVSGVYEEIGNFFIRTTEALTDQIVNCFTELPYLFYNQNRKHFTLPLSVCAIVGLL